MSEEDEDVHEMVLIADHWFEIERELGLVYLTPVVQDGAIASVVGMGEDMERAKRDVRINAITLLEELSPEKFPDEFIDFALDVYTDTTNEDGQCMCSTCRVERGELETDTK